MGTIEMRMRHNSQLTLTSLMLRLFKCSWIIPSRLGASACFDMECRRRSSPDRRAQYSFSLAAGSALMR